MSDAPSAWKIEQALAAWHEAKEALGDDADPDLGSQPEADVERIIERIIRAHLNASYMALVAKLREANLAQRRQRFEGRAEALKRTALQLMQTVNKPLLVMAEVTASIRRGSPNSSVVVTDEAAVPDEYKDTKTETSVSKKRLLADMKEGVVVPGAELRNGVDSLVIRTN